VRTITEHIHTYCVFIL